MLPAGYQVINCQKLLTSSFQNKNLNCQLCGKVIYDFKWCCMPL